MSFHDLSPRTLAIIIIAAGIIIVFAISGFQARNLFAPSITEDIRVIIKNQDGTCIVEGSDNVPRTISNCPYYIGDIVSITYKPQQPSIERHELRQAAATPTTNNPTSAAAG
jgi:hypothetical protein